MKQLTVTDHALLRYIERGLGVDVESYRRALATMLSSKMLAGTTEAVITIDGARFVIRNSSVVTCLESNRGLHNCLEEKRR